MSHSFLIPDLRRSHAGAIAARIVVAAFVAAFSSGVHWLQAQTPAHNVTPAAAPVAPPALDASERKSVVDRIATLLDENYVFPDVARSSGEKIKKDLASGAFDRITDPKEFAERLTESLQSVNHDKHMRVRVRQVEDSKMAMEDPDAMRAREMRDMRQRNFGFQKVERLDGNIGYLDLRGFAPVPFARETAINAMGFLANTDAVIVDLRKNGGGSPGMVQLLCSYFFGTRTHLNSLYYRKTDATEEYWTLDSVPGRRRPDVPLFVLTSGTTFSGAEEFTYNLKTRKRATIVGETTGGGANPGGMMPVNDRFGIFVPTGRAINPVTGTNWEGTGVAPDVAVSAGAALDTVLALAGRAAKEYRASVEAREEKAQAEFKREIDRARELFQQKKIDEGTKAVTTLLKKGITAGTLDEMAINTMGYGLLERDQKSMAIAVFTFNVDAYPESSNVYDSLGEAYMMNGQKALAITNYRRSLELDPKNSNAVVMLKKLGE